MIHHLKFISVWISLIPQLTESGNVTWFEPTPVRTTSDKDEVLPPGIVQVYKGSPAALNWRYSLSSSQRLGAMRFNNDLIVSIESDGSAGRVTDNFQGRFSVSSTVGRVSLSIAAVTADDDKENGEFTCEVVDFEVVTWKRAIQVQVLEPTRIIGYSGNKTIKENSDVTLFCNTTGKPTANITWTRVLDDGSDGEKMFDGSPWFIRNIKRTRNGTYRCSAYNGFGNAVTRSVHINVTYPAGIENLQREILEASYQTITLLCPAEGNPPPKYTWSPCKKGVCDEPKLKIETVVSDEVYTCSVTNSLGSDAENVTLFIAARTVNVTLVITSEKCTDGKYNASSIEDKLINLMAIIFEGSDPNYNGAEFKNYSCGSVTVNMALKFKNITKEKYVIEKIRTAVRGGTTGGFTFDVSSITGTRIPSEGTTTVTTTPTRSREGLKLWMIALIVVAVLFLVVLVGNICCWCFGTTICIVLVIRFIRKCMCKENQDSKEVHTNECQDTERDRGYASVDHQYAVTGPNTNYRASNPSSWPPATYEIANRESEGRRGHGASAPEKPLPEYAVVDKAKKKKKTPKPGELQYAELGDLTGRGKKATLPPVSGTSTVYAEVN